MAGRHSYLRKYLDKRLFNRLRSLNILSLVLLVAIVFEVVFIGFNILFAIISIFVGLCVGVIVSRMYHLSWDSESNQVISNMDWIGAIIFIFYIIFMIVRSILVGYLAQGNTYMGIILSVTAGVMIGRIMGTEHSIIRIKEDLKSIKRSLVT